MYNREQVGHTHRLTLVPTLYSGLDMIEGNESKD